MRQADEGPRPETLVARRRRLPVSFSAPALRNPDFRLFWAGNVAAYFGHWAQIVGVTWLVLELTDSPLYLGLLGLARAVPAIPLAVYGGALADRVPKRTLLFATQGTSLLVSAAFLALVVAGLATPVWAFLLTLVWSTANALDGAARQSIVAEIVEKDHLLNAVALNATSFSLAHIVGPGLAGAVIAWQGTAGAFLLASVGVIVMLSVLLFVRQGRRVIGAPRPWRTDLLDGLRYVRGQRAVAGLLGLVAGATFFGMAYTVLVPLVATRVLGGDAGVYGTLLSMSAAGGLASSLALSFLGGRWPRGLLLQGSVLAFGALLVAFGASQWFLVMVALSGMIGAANSLYLTTANTLLQSIAAPEMRGRVMGLYVLSPAGLHHLGSLFLGATAEAVGASVAIIGAGVVTIAIAVTAAARLPEIRRL